MSSSSYFEQISSLFQEQLYSNVITLAGLVLTLSEKLNDILSGTEHLQVLIIMGDSLYQLQEYPRSEVYYRKALQMFKNLVKTTPTSTKEVFGDDCSNDLKYKLYLCHVQCKKPLEALSTLQSIPAKQRTPRTNMALGRLYLQNGMERAAITSFKEVLRQCPMALEAMEALLSLGLKEGDLQVFTNQKASKMPYPDWFFTWLKGNCSFYSRDYVHSLHVFNYLQEKTALQNNHYLLVSIGLSHILSGDYKAAIGPLKVAHMNDPLNMAGMDLLSFLLWSEKRTSELEKLMCKLVELNHTENKSEPWISLAYFASLTNRSSRAIYFAHRGAFCNGFKNPEGLLAKGNILLDLKKYQEALECFREAMCLSPFRFEPHKGIVDCYIAMQRYRDALTIASTASKKLGQTPRVLTMCASAMKRDPLTVSKAKSYLEKALVIDSYYLPAIFMLVDILEHEGQYTSAIQLLTKQIENQCNPPQLHLRLANLLCKNNMEDKAADHFAIALRLDPNNRDAKEGLNRLDPASNRAVHEGSNSFELVDDLELDDDDDDDNQAESEFDQSMW